MRSLHINREYFKSKLFIRMFASYLMIIITLFLIYTVVVLTETKHINEERQNQYYHLKVQQVANVLDLQFMDADIIASNINSSNAIKRFSTARMDTGNVTEYDVISEIKSFITSSRNLNIYDAVLFFNNVDKAFSSIQSYNLDKVYNNDAKIDDQKIVITSLNEDFYFNNAATVFQKQWIVYKKDYSSSINKGSVCVLLDKNSIQNCVKDILGEDKDITLCLNDIDIYSTGKIQNQVIFDAKSFMDNNISYKLIVDNSSLKGGNTAFMFMAIAIAIILTIVFIVLAWNLSNKYYQPFGSIERLMDGQILEKDSDELQNIISGIQSLIGERNGYREKMLTVKPYVEQGVFYDMLNGNLEPEKLDVYLKEEYFVLQKPYFILSVVNIAYTGDDTPDKEQCKRISSVIEDVAREYSAEDLNVVLYNKDLFNIFMIINSNTNDQLEMHYYELYTRIVRRIDNEDYAITIGVDQVREELVELTEACNNAVKTLGTMVVGGRSAVYFYEKEIKADKQKYFFPKDALNRLIKALKDRNLLDIRTFLDEIKNKNMKKYDMSPATMQLLIDEVHITTIKALKNVNSLNLIDFSIEKLKTIATLEEVLDYYYAVYVTICKKLEEIAISPKDIGKLDQDIIGCIDEQYRNPAMSLQYISEKFGVSNKYISVICKKYLGMTYLQYLQEKRIGYAVLLMKTTQYSLEQIANTSGYTNMITFRRNFKSVEGVNPSEFLGDGIQ